MDENDEIQFVSCDEIDDTNVKDPVNVDQNVFKATKEELARKKRFNKPRMAFDSDTSWVEERTRLNSYDQGQIYAQHVYSKGKPSNYRVSVIGSKAYLFKNSEFQGRQMTDFTATNGDRHLFKRNWTKWPRYDLFMFYEKPIMVSRGISFNNSLGQHIDAIISVPFHNSSPIFKDDSDMDDETIGKHVEKLADALFNGSYVENKNRGTLYFTIVNGYSLSNMLGKILEASVGDINNTIDQEMNKDPNSTFLDILEKVNKAVIDDMKKNPTLIEMNLEPMYNSIIEIRRNDSDIVDDMEAEARTENRAITIKADSLIYQFHVAQKIEQELNE